MKLEDLRALEGSEINKAKAILAYELQSLFMEKKKQTRLSCFCLVKVVWWWRLILSNVRPTVTIGNDMV